MVLALAERGAELPRIEGRVVDRVLREGKTRDLALETGDGGDVGLAERPETDARAKRARELVRALGFIWALGLLWVGRCRLPPKNDLAPAKSLACRSVIGQGGGACRIIARARDQDRAGRISR
jgi:hypothetical protein